MCRIKLFHILYPLGFQLVQGGENGDKSNDFPSPRLFNVSNGDKGKWRSREDSIPKWSNSRWKNETTSDPLASSQPCKNLSSPRFLSASIILPLRSYSVIWRKAKFLNKRIREAERFDRPGWNEKLDQKSSTIFQSRLKFFFLDSLFFKIFE